MTKDSLTLEFEFLMQLPLEKDETVVSTGVGPRGELALITVGSEVALPLTRKSYQAVLVLVDQQGWSSRCEVTLQMRKPIFQPLPDGELLVVDARAEANTANAIVFGSDGELLRKFRVGEYISDVKADKDGLIWVGYIDQAYGNSKGFYGLCCFSTSGTTELLRHVGQDQILDCYALTVENQTVWACTYPGFPVIRCGVDSGERVWQTPSTVSGVRALAVYYDRVLLYGSYGDIGNDCLLLTVGQSDNPQYVVDCQLVLPDGSPLPNDVTVLGVGSQLHAVTADGEWLMVDMSTQDRIWQ